MNHIAPAAQRPLLSLPRQAQPARLAQLSADFAASAASYDRSGQFPHENFEALHEAGLVGLAAIRALDGQQLSLAEAREIITAVARGEPSTALVLLMTYLFVLQAAENPSWNPELRRQVLEDIALNGSLANALRVEPGLGTPIRGGLPGTVARRVDGGWRISGHKIYSTGIPRLSWLAVWGRTDEAQPRVGVFLVPRASEGITVEESWDQLGLRASGSHDVIFKDVFIPEDYAVDIRLPEAWAVRDAGFTQWMAVLLGSIYDSVARNARDFLVEFARNRVPSNLGAPLSTLPRFQEVLGSIDALLHVNQALLERGTAASAENFSAQDANFLKHIVTNNAIQVTEKALAITGNPGLSRANPLERHHRDALCGRVHSPQDDTILLQAGLAGFNAWQAKI